MPSVEISGCDEHAIEGTVYDRKVLEWDIFPEEGDPDGHYCSCKCRGFAECPHLVAAIIYILRESQRRKSAAGAMASLGAAPASPKKLTGLKKEVAEKSEGALGAAALQYMQQVKAWWETGRSRVQRHELVRLCTGSPYYDARPVQLYPSPDLKPATVQEYFYCVTAAAREVLREGYAPHRLPAGIEAAVDEEWIKNFRERAERIKQIEQWKYKMREWDAGLMEDEVQSKAPELRLLLSAAGATLQVRRPDQAEFGKLTGAALKQLHSEVESGDVALDPCSAAILHAAVGHYGHKPRLTIDAGSAELSRCVQQLLTSEQTAARHLAAEDGNPLEVSAEPLRYELKEPAAAGGDYLLSLLTPQGTKPPAFLAVAGKNPVLFIGSRMVWPGPVFPFPPGLVFPVKIPDAALESSDGLKMLSALGLPPPSRIARDVQVVPLKVKVRCRMHRYQQVNADYFQLTARASEPRANEEFRWNGSGWARVVVVKPKMESQPGLLQIDRSLMGPAGVWLRSWQMRLAPQDNKDRMEQRITKDFPDLFIDWLTHVPEGVVVEMDSELASLRDGVVAGSFALELEQSRAGIDWFDLTMQLKVEDHTLTQAEIDLLLKAKGKWVQLPEKGWRKLQFQLTAEQERELAELGISAGELNGERHRLHALQMASSLKGSSSLLAAEQVAAVQRRVDEIRLDVAPPQPAEVIATLRPYQLEGFQFLAFLSTNRFGGVLADDMGLGKTLQALTWLAWLRTAHGVRGLVLVVCPKSVQENWRSEAARFFPSLPVHTWSRGAAGELPEDMDGLLIVHYPQLRQHEALLQPVKWAAVILDEAQAIKNPTSQTAAVACGLTATHRLALTGTPVENRLMDLWSIFAFAMPGLLGTRAAFTRQFDAKADPLARRRLSARTRPFLLRRTKKEVASDLPDRVEEDVMVEMEGAQAALYQAELKRARAQLLKISTGSQLDKLRFNILTSLLRLRQICCHPALIGMEPEPGAAKPARGKKKAATAEAKVESGKLSALMEHLEAIIEEEQKVLVFSQFTGMLDLIAAEIDERGWTRFLLTGQTEDRGALVNEFQNHTGPAVFLISLKAGGFGLNLTAASYVVLYDPWWNPAVEAQAIDRTHRIGQKQTVFAYRLLMKDTIEEKIRALQKQKGALAQDILGEENFARALSLDDFRFLLGE